MNLPAAAYLHLMFLTLLALLGTGCTRGINESPVQFDERRMHHTENMTPEEWEAFKNKAIESIIRKYTHNAPNSLKAGEVRIVDLDQPAPKAAEGPCKGNQQAPSASHGSNHLVIPETLEPTRLPQLKTPPRKSDRATFEKVDRYSQLKIKPQETKGKHYKIPPNAVTQSSASPSPSPAAIYVWPTDGNISLGYGNSPKGKNNGINITAKSGSPVVAVDNGKVIFVGAIKGMGKVILIEHPNQIIAAYAQVGEIKVRANDRVQKAQVIASVLNSHNGSGEIHFELRKGTKILNPEDYLPKKS